MFGEIDCVCVLQLPVHSCDYRFGARIEMKKNCKLVLVVYMQNRLLIDSSNAWHAKSVTRMVACIGRRNWRTAGAGGTCHIDYR